MKTYFCTRGQGERDGGMPVMVQDTDRLTFSPEPHPLQHHVFHSPDGYAWGYGGSGPSELAKDILWDFTGTKPEPAVYHAFKDEFIATQPQDQPFYVSGAAIALWLASR